MVLVNGFFCESGFFGVLGASGSFLVFDNGGDPGISVVAPVTCWGRSGLFGTG